MPKVIKIIIFFLVAVNYAYAQHFSINFIDIKSGKKLKKQSTRDTQVVNNLVVKYVTSLHNRGYLEASADSIIFNQKKITVWIHKGPRYYLDTLIIIHTDTILHAYKNKPFTGQTLNLLINNTIAGLDQKGYPFARTKDMDCRLHNNHFSCTVRINPGSHYVFDTLKVIDSQRINRRFLQNYLGLNIGRPFSYSQIHKIPDKISQLDFITLADTPQVEFYPGLARPVISLRHRKVNSAEALIGLTYQNRQLTTIGHLNLHLRALFQAEDFTLSWDKPRPQWQQLKLSLQIPYLFGYPLGIKLYFSSQKIDTTQLNQNLTAGLSYYFLGMSHISFSWQSISNLATQNTSLEKTVRKRLISTTLHIDSRDNPFSPRRGLLVNGSFAYGHKLLQDSTSWTFTYSAQIEKFTPLSRKIILLTGLRAAQISSPAIYGNEVMHIGGYENFRGFGEQQFPATEYYLFTAEARLRFSSYSYLLAFAEKGVINEHTIQTRQSLRTTAIGLGINLMLKNSVINLTYALGTTDRSQVPNASKIHISYRLVF